MKTFTSQLLQHLKLALLVGVVLAGFIFFVPQSARAEPDRPDITIETLQQVIAELQTRIDNMTQQKVSGNSSVPSGTTRTSIADYSNLPNEDTRSFLRNLYRGIRDDNSGKDVTYLQKCLDKTGDYNYGEYTGYYGPVTEEAVQRFQSRVGIASSGTALTTGFGLVGPKTREKLRAFCAKDAVVEKVDAEDSRQSESRTTDEKRMIINKPNTSILPTPESGVGRCTYEGKSYAEGVKREDRIMTGTVMIPFHVYYVCQQDGSWKMIISKPSVQEKATINVGEKLKEIALELQRRMMLQNGN